MGGNAMTEMVINQLKEYAIVTADDMHIDVTGGEFTEEVQSAYQRAMEFSELICPVCWVKDNKASTLNISGKSDSTALYECSICGFNEELEKES